MSTKQLLSHSPAQLAQLLNEVLADRRCTLEDWLRLQALDREVVLQHLERSGFVYLPDRNRVE